MLYKSTTYKPLKSVGSLQLFVVFYGHLLYNNSIVIEKGTKMEFENKVLAVVKSVTNVPATFTNGTLFLNTLDSKTAVKVFNAIYSEVTAGIMMGTMCSETYYDFV